MRMSEIDEAEAEAIRFLDRVHDLRTRIKDDPHVAQFWEIVGCKESGAVKRASMDLSRSLVALRR